MRFPQVLSTSLTASLLLGPMTWAQSAPPATQPKPVTTQTAPPAAQPGAIGAATNPPAKEGTTPTVAKPVEPEPVTPKAPATPTTTVFAAPGVETRGTNKKDAAPDPYLDFQPMPKGTVSLVGGVVRHVDQVRNRMAVDIFGGQKMGLRFDERTHIFRDGVETTQLGIHKGDRVYVDTQLDHQQLFARNVHVLTEAQPADARGQLSSYDPRSGRIVVQDELSSSPVSFSIDKGTILKRQGAATTAADLLPGALLAVRFAPDRANRGVAREISITAVPGLSFLFAGNVTYLNVASGLLALRNASDGKTYEIRFDPASPAREQLGIGAQVSINATFEGTGYRAQNISVTQATAKAPPQ